MFSHGYSNTRTHSCWKSMKSRCNNSNHPKYKYYGGRGISYDPRWEKFEEFLKDMGECPEGMTLERNHNDKGYSKENCSWETQQTQNRNRGDYRTKNPYPGVHWMKSRTPRDGGCWRAYTKVVNGKRVNLYSGPDLQLALEARQFYESFILGIEK